MKLLALLEFMFFIYGVYSLDDVEKEARLEFPAGEIAEFNCSVKSIGNNSIQWFVNETLLNVSDAHIQESYSESVSHLLVYVLPSDSGWYHCASGPNSGVVTFNLDDGSVSAKKLLLVVNGILSKPVIVDANNQTVNNTYVVDSQQKSILVCQIPSKRVTYLKGKPMTTLTWVAEDKSLEVQKVNTSLQLTVDGSEENNNLTVTCKLVHGGKIVEENSILLLVDRNKDDVEENSTQMTEEYDDQDYSALTTQESDVEGSYTQITEESILDNRTRTTQKSQIEEASIEILEENDEMLIGWGYGLGIPLSITILLITFHALYRQRIARTQAMYSISCNAMQRVTSVQPTGINSDRLQMLDPTQNSPNERF